MSKDKKYVYVATEGDYSNFHITGVYDSQENAEKSIIKLAKKLLPEYREGYWDEDDMPDDQIKAIMESRSWSIYKWPLLSTAKIMDEEEIDGVKEIIFFKTRWPGRID